MIFRLSFCLTSKHSKKNPSGSTTDTHQRHPPTTRQVLSLMRTPANDPSGSTSDTHHRHPPTTRRVFSLMRAPANEPSGSTTDTHQRHPPTTRRVLLWLIMASQRHPRSIYPSSHTVGTRATRPVWRRVSRAKNSFFRQSLPKRHLIINKL